MKLMAIDYGAKRVGIASTDDSGTFALPRATLLNDKDLIDNILKFKKEDGAEIVIMGESMDFSGKPNPIMMEANKLKVELEKRGVGVILHPEVLTTVEARRLQGQTHMTDASAAALILKNYIDSLRR